MHTYFGPTPMSSRISASMRRRVSWPAVVLAFAGFLALTPAASSAQAAPARQTATDVGTDLHFHKFQPKMSPEMAAQSASTFDRTVDASGISRFAAAQMNALQQEKASRTPAQQKIDSNVLYTERMLQGQDAAPGVSYLETGVDLDDNNNIAVDMVANVSEALLAKLAAAGASVLYTNAPLRSIRAVIPPAKIEGIAALPEVVFISPLQGSDTNRVIAPKKSLGRSWPMAPAFKARMGKVLADAQSVQPNVGSANTYGQGSIETEGDQAHQATNARGTYGLTGAGLKIGVLSNGVATAALSQAKGDLPPTCGTGVPSPCLTVLSGQAGTGDEGTAMLEIIHDMVPGADLFFATANPTITQFATNIRALKTAGCNIIVDDVGYFLENPFQDGQTSSLVTTTNGGVVTQAVNDVTAAGAMYFSSAANSGSVDNNTSGTYEGDFSGMAATSPVPTTGLVHNFGGNGYDTVTAPSSSNIASLFWADPLGGSANDYDLYLLNSTGTAVLASSTNVQSGTQDPAEIFQSTSLTANTRLVVYQKPGAANRFFHLNIYRGTLAVNTPGETHGHSSATGGNSVAATPAAGPFSASTPTGPFPGPFTASNKTETFSSDGPRRIFFNADSTPITAGNFSSSGGTLLNKPDITAADGVSVTGVGGFGSPFYGTSAAAPSAASIAALVMAAKPGITTAQVKTAMTSTAVDIMGAGYDRDAGNGIVMALPAIQSLGVSGGANLEFGTISATENPGDGNGSIDAGEGAQLVVPLKNTTGVQGATGITATLTSSTPGVVIQQPATVTYPDLAVGAGPVNGATPFTFALANNYVCAQSAEFSLSLSYSGGQTRVLTFTVPTGTVTASLTNTLGSTAAVPSGITFATGTQTSRVNRSGVASTCGTAKAYPGAITGANHVYDSYTFQSCSAACLQPQLTSSTGSNLFQVLYSPSFSPSSISTNYAGDAGSSNTTTTFGVQTTASTTYSLVISDVNGNTSANTYTVQVPACTFKCNTYPFPIALAKNVTVNAAVAGGTASASIDNGSNDPSGGPVTITQYPAGPYSIGTTSVTLTITNKYGAFAQATGTVTVKPPPVAPTITWGPATYVRFLGLPVGSDVLNATANASGALAYTALSVSTGTPTSITASSTLPLGAYSLSVTFTPDDPTSYTTKTVTLTSAFVVINQELFVVNSGGSVLSTYDNGASQSAAISGGGTGAAVDANGFVWSINTSGSSVSKFTDAGAFSASYSGAGISNAKVLAIDGAGMVWTANGGGTVSALTNAGAAVSTTPYAAAGGINNPASLSVDTAGSLWIANSGNGTVTEVIGVAAPVAAPAVQQVIAGTPGTRP